MKKVNSCQSIFIFLNFLACSIAFVSCSKDNFIAEDSTTSIQKVQNTTSLRMGDIMPINSDNPYDSVGSIHNELFETYFELQNQPQTLASIVNRVDSIANTHNDFVSIKSTDYHAVSLSRIQYLIAANDTIVFEVINGTNMTVPAKESLNSFVNSLLSLLDKEDNCDVFYDFVVNYEATIINNPLFVERDKRIILTASSIVRHITYRAMKRPKKNTDPDWDLLIGNIMGSIDGAICNEAEAITKALVAGIAQNQ